jgi:DNA-binding protein YbaB
VDPYQFLDDFENKAKQMQQQLAQSEEAFANARSEASSPDGSVTVVVAGGGAIESLQLSPKSVQLGHQELASKIIQTIRTAQTQAARAVEDSMRPLLGEGEGMNFLSEQVAAGIAKADAAPEPTENAPAQRGRAAQEVDLDEFDDEWDDWGRGGRR